MKLRHHLAMLAAGTCMASSVFAAGASNGMYVDASIGKSFWNVDCSGSSNCKSNDTAYKLLAGYNVDPHWGAELGYYSLGTIGANVTIPTYGAVAGASVKGNGIEIVGVYRIDYGNNVAVFGKLGIGQTKTESTYTIPVPALSASSSISRTQAVFGVGATYGLTPNLALRADIDARRVNAGSGNSSNATSVTIGLQAHF